MEIYKEMHKENAEDKQERIFDSSDIFEKCNFISNYLAFKIPTDFAISNLKNDEIFEARISYIYDLSKFWLVRKYNELKAFDMCVFRFYYKNHKKYQIPENEINMGMYCIAFSGGSYYRGQIIGCSPSIMDKSLKYVKIFFCDYGLIDRVNIKHIYYMLDSYFSVPQFAVRASLAKIRPVSKSTWTSRDVARFSEITMDKIVIVLVGNTDPKHQVIDVFLKVSDANVTVQKTLIREEIAQHFQEIKDTSVKNDSNDSFKFTPIVKNLYLFPSHEMLENGIVPNNILHVEFLKPLLYQKGPLRQLYKLSKN